MGDAALSVEPQTSELPKTDATRILREIKLLRQLKHPDIVEVKHILLPPTPRDFRDLYVVFELMETDLHQVIKANDDLTQEHHQVWLVTFWCRALDFKHSFFCTKCCVA